MKFLQTLAACGVASQDKLNIRQPSDMTEAPLILFAIMSAVHDGEISLFATNRVRWAQFCAVVAVLSFPWERNIMPPSS